MLYFCKQTPCTGLLLLFLKAFNYGLAYIFWDLVHYHHVREQDSRNANHGTRTVPDVEESYILIPRQQGKRKKQRQKRQTEIERERQRLILPWDFETSSPTPNEQQNLIS